MMMLGDDKKKISTTVIDKLMEESPSDVMADSSMAKKAAMEKFAAGLDAKDFSKMAAGMEEFMTLCESEEHMMGPEIEMVED